MHQDLKMIILLTCDCCSILHLVIKETGLSSLIVRAITQGVTSRDAAAYVRDNPPMMDSSYAAIYANFS
jgi:hypothetical protein